MKTEKLVSASIVFLMIVFTLYAPSRAETPTLTLTVKNKIDVALSVANSTVDVSNFEQDLKNALAAKGSVPAEDIYVSAVEATQVDAQSNFSWVKYDHLFSDCSTPTNYHINIQGTTIYMYGYAAPAYKDFMYMPNDMATKKTFMFRIDETTISTHTLEGAGFLFNTSITGTVGSQTMSGYLMYINYYTSKIEIYKFQNVDVEDFHNQAGTLIASYPGFTKLTDGAASPYPSTKYIKVEATPSYVKVWEGLNSNYDLNALRINYSLTQTFGSYGFGPLAGYSSHGCCQSTVFSFRDIQMTTDNVRSLTEVVREPEWHDRTQKFIVNLNELHIADFDNDQTVAEIISRMSNDDIYYIGWGTDVNQDQSLAFLQRHNVKGTFVNMNAEATDTYAEQVNAIADHILLRYNSAANDPAYVIVGEDVRFSAVNASLTSTINADWPQGRWKVVHDITGFENTTGLYAYNNTHTSDLDLTFNKPGTYDIYYEDVLIRTVIAHRKPLALFTVSYSSGTVTLDSSSSYDPDSQSGSDKGIAAEEWKYLDVARGTWTSGRLTTAVADKNYIVSLKVQDTFGAWSNELTKSLYTGSGSVKPIAEFALSINEILKNVGSQTIDIIDTSYDPSGSPITVCEWTVTKNAVVVYEPSSTAKTDFSADAAGTYKISLRVQSANGWSESFSRFVTVIQDSTPPLVSVNPANGIASAIDVTLTFSDAGGSSLKYQQYALASTTTTPEEGWSTQGNSLIRNVTVSQSGTWYIHYKAEDNAGNILTGYAGTYVVNPAIIKWTCEGGDQKWSNKDNWDSGDTPGANQVVLFEQNCTVDIDVAATVAGVIISASGVNITKTSTGSLIVNGDFIQQNGTFNGGTGTVDINGEVNLTGGTFTATSGELHISGDFTVSGSAAFNHNDGTMVLDGGDQSILACNVTFKNLVKHASNTSTLTFIKSPCITTVEGILDLQGTAGALLSLRSSASDGTDWIIHPQGAKTLKFLDVKDSESSVAVTAYYSKDSGSNTNWTFDRVDPMIDPLSASFNAAGGDGTVEVIGDDGDISATSHDSWLTVALPVPADGPVTYHVAANTGTNSRLGTITIAGWTFCVKQGGTATDGLQATSVTVANQDPGDPAILSVTVTPAQTMENVPSEIEPTMVIAMIATNVSNATNRISFCATFDSLPANPVFYKIVNGNWYEIYPQLHANLAGSITIDSFDAASRKLCMTISDNSAADSNTLSGIIQDPVVAGCNGVCGGTTTTTIDGGGSGGGGNTCGLSVKPEITTISFEGGTGTVQVMVNHGTCVWSSYANAPWISINSGTNDIYGNGDVVYSVDTNRSSEPRQGRIFVSTGYSVLITQDGAAAPTTTTTISATSVPTTTTTVVTPAFPNITSSPIFTAVVNKPYTYQVKVVPEAYVSGSLIFSLDEAPEGMKIDADTGLIAWSPAIKQLGKHTVQVKVENDYGQWYVQKFDIRVALFDCPIVATLGEDAEDDLNILRKFRDKRLSSTALGSKYVGLFYQHASSITPVLMSNPKLKQHLADLINEQLPNVQVLIGEGQVTIDSNVVIKIDDLLEDMEQADANNKELAQVLRSIRDDLKNPETLRQFGITIK